MKIAFVNPPAISPDLYLSADDCCVSLTTGHILPAMIVACASEAQAAGHDVAYLDAAIEPDIDLSGFDLIIHPTAWHAHRQVNQSMAKLSGNVRRIVLGIIPGYAQDYAATSPSPFCVIYSEPEEVVRTLPQDAADLPAWRQKAKGIAWLSGRRKRMSGPLPNCLHTLHDVDFHLVPSHYWPQFPQVSYQVARGCPYRCTFCMWGGSTVTDPTFRMRPANQVARGLRLIRELAGKPIIPGTYLICAQLTTDIRWVRAFHAEMKDDPYPYRSNINLAEVTAEKMRLLKESGLTFATAGLEGMTDRTLAMMKKGHTFVQAMKAIMILEDSGVPYRLHLRAGYGEIAEDVAEATENLDILASFMEHGKLDLGPLIHYQGTAICETSYPLKPHPNYAENCPWMANMPSHEWAMFAARMARYGLLYKRGLKGWPAEFQAEYRCNYNKLKESGWPPDPSLPSSPAPAAGP